MTDTTIVSSRLRDALEREGRRIAESALRPPRVEEFPVPARGTLLADAEAAAAELGDRAGMLDGVTEQPRRMR